MHVNLFYHVRHARNLDGTVEHTADGELTWDEESGDNVKLLGVYSSDEHARERIRQAQRLPGFIDEPNCFMVTQYQVDEDHWSDGYITIPDPG